MRRALTWILTLSLAAAAIAGCGGAKAPDTKSPPPTSEAKAEEPIRIDVIPTQKSEKFQDQIGKLGVLLSQETGYKIEMRIPADYAAVVEAMRFGKTDIAYFGPFTYVVANAQSGAQAFVTMNIKGKPFYYSYAIVAKDSPIQDLDDKAIASLKGKKIALGDPSSTSSSQIPQLALKNAGLDREQDVKLAFTGAHDAVLKTVVAGKADIGFLDSAIFEGSLQSKFPADYAKVRVVWKSMELYQYPWAHRRDLDPVIVGKLKDAFLKITDQAALEPFGADSFVAADDAKYDPVRDAAAALGIELKNYQLKK